MAATAAQRFAIPGFHAAPCKSDLEQSSRLYGTSTACLRATQLTAFQVQQAQGRLCSARGIRVSLRQPRSDLYAVRCLLEVRPAPHPRPFSPRPGQGHAGDVRPRADWLLDQADRD
nr:hypothetical protein CFP56_56578 [Quercus suber]